MRTRTKSIVTAFVLLSLVSGAIGCRSNGGPWYNPKSYTWHNPFKSGDAPAYEAAGTAQANPKPSMGAQPDVNVPPGGYTNKEDEARFLAGKKEGTVMVPQYGATETLDNSRVATTTGMAAPQSVYPETPVYSPYAANPIATPSAYQDTSLHTAGVPQNTMYHTGAPASDPMVYPGMAPSATPAVTPNAAPAGGYSPYANPIQANPVQQSAPIYGEPVSSSPAAMPAYGQATTAPQGFAAQPAAPQTGYAQPQVQQGYAAPVNSNPPANAGMPMIYPSSTPQGF